MINKIETKKSFYRNILAIFLIAAVVFSSGFFYSQNIAEAKKKKSKVTKWQRLLEQNGVDQSLWQKYLPKVSRKEYKKAVKALKKQGSVSGSGSLGPEIKIGLFRLIDDNDKKVKIASNTGFNIKDKYGNVYKTVDASVVSEIKANYSDKIFKVDGVVVSDLLTLESLSGDGIFEIKKCGSKFKMEKNDKGEWVPNKIKPIGCYDDPNREDEKYDKFRGKIEFSFDKNDDNEKEAWIINQLPLEQYTWGTGEIGKSKDEYYKLFSIIYRTYGYYNIQNTKSSHKKHRFNLYDSSLDQIYKGYKIESYYSDMKKATQETRGVIITYKGEVALTPYCSYTNGHTVAKKGYDYLQSVKDHKEGTKEDLKPGEGGNHMEGLSAHGAVGYIGDGWGYKKVLHHYYSDKVKIESSY